MPIFHYSLHARFANDFSSGANIGLLLWTEDSLHFFGVAGAEDIVQKMNERIALIPKRTREEVAGFVEYYQTRYGGYFESISKPHKVTGDSVQDAARRAGRRWKLKLIITDSAPVPVPEPDPVPDPVPDPDPVPSTPKIDPVLIQELFRATEDGAELQIQGRDLAGGDIAFALAYGAIGKDAVLGYLPFPYSFSHYARGRFWLDSVERIDGGWLARGRDNWNFEAGTLEITIRPVLDQEILDAIFLFKFGLSEEEVRLIESRLNYLGSPQYL